MNDVAMCSGYVCPIREKCQRYILGQQSGGWGYWTMAMYQNGKCKNFKPKGEENEKRRN